MKCLAFCGREHHMTRLRDTILLLREKGHDVAWVVSDNAIQVDIPEVPLIRANEPFLHVLDYFQPTDTPAISAIARDLLKMPLATADTDLYTFIEPFWIAYSAREFSEALVGFGRLFKAEKPDRVLILHEGNAWGKLIAYLCYEMSIPCFAFQEGLLRHRDQETQGKQALAADYSTLFVWSEASKAAYVKSGIPDDKLRVVGMSHLDPYIKRWNGPERDNWKAQFKYSFGLKQEPLVTFALPLASRYEGDINQGLNAIVDWASSTVTQLIIRPHPFDNSSQFKQAVTGHPWVKVMTEGDTPDFLAASDVVLCQHSTVAVEALALGSKVCEFDYSSVGVLESLVEQGVATGILGNELDKITKVLKGEIVIPPEVLEPWKNVNLGPLDGKGAERVVECLVL